MFISLRNDKDGWPELLIPSSIIKSVEFYNHPTEGDTTKIETLDNKTYIVEETPLEVVQLLTDPNSYNKAGYIDLRFI